MAGLQMIDFGRSLAESGIKSENPGISDTDLKAKIFKRFYKNDFDADEMEKICKWLRTEVI